MPLTFTNKSPEFQKGQQQQLAQMIPGSDSSSSSELEQSHNCYDGTYYKKSAGKQISSDDSSLEIEIKAPV